MKFLLNYHFNKRKIVNKEKIEILETVQMDIDKVRKEAEAQIEEASKITEEVRSRLN